MIIMKDTNERINGDYYYCLMPEKENGSPLNKPCTTTCCLRTADRKSTSRQISKASGPVPLYLIPQALSKEIRELKDAIVEIQINRTSGHNYLINLISTAKEAATCES
ncbi:hypothetical protein Mpet_1685 [Methanolacinia petrolearia DSM 11571]|uniref:Uncharacterized protein n=2 Tax=Methanolacinia TaxID=230355 RepID=E1RHD4_METP4|nr:hypothetical protein Mpet_1685 [Methanolacinia petrolearia DSM 11571]